MNNDQPMQSTAKLKNVKIWIIMSAMPVVLFLLGMILAIIIPLGFNRATITTCNSSPGKNSISNGSSLKAVDSTECTADIDTTSSTRVGLKVLQLVLGIGAVVTLLLEPLWITMMVLAIQHNNKLKYHSVSTPPVV